MIACLPRTITYALFAGVVVLATGLVPQNASGAEFNARIGHLESAKQSRHVHLEKVAALIRKRTNGAVTFELFPQGQLGNQRQMTESAQLGSIQATVAPASFLGGFNPAVSILDIPFLLPADKNKAQKILGSEFADAVLSSFASRGLTGVAIWPNGRKNFTSNKPLGNLEAFKGQKFRVMDSKILIEQFRALDASAIALPFGELYTSLQTGLVDGQENPLDTIQRMKFHEVQKHLVLSEHGALVDVVLFNTAWWEKLSASQRSIIRQAFREVIPGLRAHKQKSVEMALSAIKDSLHTRSLSDSERHTLRARMYPRAKAAYLERAGADGKRLIELYETVRARVDG